MLNVPRGRFTDKTEVRDALNLLLSTDRERGFIERV